MFSITTANQVRQTSHKAQRKSRPVGLRGVRHYGLESKVINYLFPVVYERLNV
jgi:hypothetical protein